MTTAENGAVAAFAPAKINLSLHVTGRRPDGYHLLDSLVAFADIGDHLSVRLSDRAALSVSGPMSDGVPEGPDNLCLKAVEFFGTPAALKLDKRLPNQAGIGGGSSDAAAVLRALVALTGRPVPPQAERLGADVPVCIVGRAARVSGIGERVAPVPSFPPLPAVLVNPGVTVSTPAVFARLERRENAPMPAPFPQMGTLETALAALADFRNDLEAPARAVAPVIGDVLDSLARSEGCALARMSGSGATCFGLFHDGASAEAAAAAIGAAHPGWWSRATQLR